MIASLPMYDVPELRFETDALWASISDNIRNSGGYAPDTLNRDLTCDQTWTDPTLILSQTCGMPWRLGLHHHAQLVGTPDYGVEGCPPGFYRSMIVVRKDDQRTTLDEFALATCAFNARNSQSGFAVWQTRQFACWKESGSHSNSIIQVANGEADIAAIDAVTWRIAQRYQSETSQLRILCKTKPTPGLPFITAQTQSAISLAAATKKAIYDLDKATRQALGIVGFVKIPSSEYLAI